VADREPGPVRTLLVALVVCAACSVIVSSTAVLLAPRQHDNRERERRAHLHALIERQPGLGAMLGGVGQHEVHEIVVDLTTGRVADWVDPADVPPPGTEADPGASTALPAERDIAGIGRRPNLGTAYVVADGDRIALVLLPVYGTGYTSTLRGYVALAGDLDTVRGVSFHEHGETPGVGGEVLSDEEWLGAWTGRRIRDDAGRLRIGTSLRELEPGSSDAAHMVDAISGATRTTVGIGNALRFWLGDDGYGPFLRRIAEEGPPR
jgi:Na+-transporting NADH:ubiquinone oxidoreductase subunit C